MSTPSTRRPSQSRFRLPLWGVGLLALFAVFFLVLSSYWLFNTVAGLAAELEVLSPIFEAGSEPAAVPGSSANDPTENLGADPAGGIIGTLIEPWSGRDRVTMLALGIDQRCDEEGPTHTDTMMLLTVDPVGLSAALLSLPRDLWVEIPGFGPNKINQAYFLGESYDYPDGGPGLAVDTVEAALGIEIDYFVTINFDAFVQVVDEVGGIDIEVPEAIDDKSYPDNCYGYDPFFISAGSQHLDGQTALKYARTRATFGGDIDRAGRQQEVILALRAKVLRLDMVPQLLTRAPELWRIFQRNVEMNLSLNEALQLALLIQDIPGESIRSEVLNYDYVYNEVTPDGQAVLIPDRDKIRLLRDQLFAPPIIPTPVIENLTEMTAAENARVAIYNGTPVFGLAGATQEYLSSFNILITEIGNADSAEYRTTQIIDYGSYPNTARYLTQLMDIPPLNISSAKSPPGDFDILIILGSDWKIPDSSSD
ncbi:MAG: LCP family protein [Anaerolineae bacterium]|nr:MAG: LCP family protein [Anaerolineae bacterium]